MTCGEMDDQRGMITVLTNLGYVASRQGDQDGALARYTDALALARAGRPRPNGPVSQQPGVEARRRGDVAQARTLLREALALYWELGNPSRCAMVLESPAETAGAAGQREQAARLLGTVAALRETIGVQPEPGDVEEVVAAARAALGDEVWAAAFGAGRTLSLEQAVAEALALA